MPMALAIVVFFVGLAHDLGPLSLILGSATYFIVSGMGKFLASRSKDQRAQAISEKLRPK
jgi:hypothetical protein